MNPSITITLKGEPGKERESVVERFREIAKYHFKDYTFWTSTSLLHERVIGMSPMAAPEPAQVTVPLGPNRTRDGREVRVIANDVKGKYPVIVVLPQYGTEIVSKRRKDGTSPYGSGGDLVGHLPPEPPTKSGPREVWALCTEDGLPFAWSHEKTGPQFKLFREVIEG